MQNFSKNQKIAIGLVIAVISIILINYVYSKETSKIEPNEEITTAQEDAKEEQEKEEQEPKEIVVHIAGAVNTEGIIFLQEGDRVNAAIDKAGGATEEADMSKVNLAYEVEDGMKIYIPKKGEQVEEENQEYLIQENTSTVEEKSKEQKTQKVNINKADSKELETLPGIGESTAAKIIKHREENGKFKSIENIKDVSGIGDAKFDSIKDLITV